MKIRKTGWIVWDKVNQKIKEKNGMFIYSSRETAWLSAGKERKGSPYKVKKVQIKLANNGTHIFQGR